VYSETPSFDHTKPTVIGSVGSGKVTSTGKWAELDYKQDKYPMFPLGSFGHVVSRPIAEYIAEQNVQKALFDYQVCAGNCTTNKWYR